MTVSPTLAPQALQLAVKEALKGRDTSLYRHIFTTYDRVHVEASDEVPESSTLVTHDTKWVDDTNTKNNAERTKLEVELKTYSSNMIKESIRVCVYRIWLSNFSDLH